MVSMLLVSARPVSADDPANPAVASSDASLELSAEGEPSAGAAEHGFRPEVDFGVGLRLALAAQRGQGVPDGLFQAELNARPYISGRVHEWLAFEVNFDAFAAYSAGASFSAVILDAVAKFEPTPYFNVWVGRFLPPSDRANLSGPYFQNAWSYPVVATGITSGIPGTGYPASIYAGRDDGVAVWGQVGGGRFKYQLGVFDLHGDPVRPMARLVLNLLDPEPGYYNASTYYGVFRTSDGAAFVRRL